MEHKTKVSIIGTIEKRAELGVGVAAILNAGSYFTRIDGTPSCERVLVPVQFEGEVAQEFVDANPMIGAKIKVEGHLKYGKCLKAGEEGTDSALLVYVDAIIEA